jgi:toxin ParE1/3/4
MRVTYSPRAIRDIEKIAAYYRKVADPTTAAAIGKRIEYVINRLGRLPYSAPRVTDRTNVRAALVLRYPYKIFYRIRGDAVEILRIRHTSRRPWLGEPH